MTLNVLSFTLSAAIKPILQSAVVLNVAALSSYFLLLICPNNFRSSDSSNQIYPPQVVAK
jgi:hypothetical protein